MKAKLIKVDGDESSLYIKKIDNINPLICKNKYESNFEILFLSDNKMMIYDGDFMTKDLQLNCIATKIAHEEDVIPPSMHIGGDVILMDYYDDFYEYI
jgi:hypothetical protein